MTGHVPFDANSDWTNPYCGNSSNDPLVDKMLGNAYHVVRSVYCNLGNLSLLYDYLTSHGIVVGVQSEDELRALPKGFTKFARIYSVNGTTGDQVVTDYLYIDDDATGIKPDDPTLTGSWIEVIVPTTGGGGGSSDGGYIPIAYNNGSANGGETLIQAPDYAVGVPFIIVDGSVQFVGYGFTYTPENSVITLAEPLEQGTEVILMCTGTPANPATPNVNDWVVVNWLYNNGAAVGGESTITIPFTFQTVPAIWKNGLRYYKDLFTQSYTVDVDSSTITLTEPLAANDRLIVQLGGEATVIDLSGPTGASMVGTKAGHTVQEELDANSSSFQDGAKLFDKNDRILDRSTTPAQLYYWDGTFPKDIAQGSTPSSTGGIGTGKWLSVGDAVLRSDLANSDPGNGVDLVAGAAKQSDLGIIQDKVDTLYTDTVALSDYSSLVTSGDWTAAIQSALDTGKDIIAYGSFNVSGVLKSKGQKLLGKWNIVPSHVTHVTDVKANVEFDDSGRLRLIYMAVHYDLCELLVIKSLGFNTISHYTNFSGHSSGAGGSIAQLLDNAATAGLKVHIDVQQAMEHHSLTPQQVVALCDPYPATWGYSVYDEPATRNISVANQESRIASLRAVTGKPLTTVDLIVTSNPPFYQKLSQKYDYVFVDSYAQRYSSGTTQDKRDWDMEKSRLDVGGMMALTRCPNILYVGGLFIDHDIGGQYTQDKQQGIDHVTNFLFHSGGEYGMFIWDMPWNSVGDDTVYNSADYQNACLKLSQQGYCEKQYIKPYLFGSAPTYSDFGLGDLMRNLPQRDPNSVQVLPWTDSFPANTFLNASDKLSGIGFKSVTANFATTIPCRKIVSVYLDTLSATGSIPGASKLELKGYNGETSRSISPLYPIGTTPTFYGSSKWDGASQNEQLLFSITNGITDSKYSLLLRGLIVCTDW